MHTLVFLVLIVIALGLILMRARSIFWVVYYGVLMVLLMPHWIVIILCTVFFGLLVAPLTRRYIIALPVLKLIEKFKLLPKISESEKIAVTSGNRGVDAELFSGVTKLSKLFVRQRELKPKEISFLEQQTEELCKLTSDWEIQNNNGISEHVMEFIKVNGFFGMIIPESYGGLGFSAHAVSTIIKKITSRSQVLAITIMVPNSLGPAELLLKYGSKLQKDNYLPKLASGEEIPCFALTESDAGSDALAVTARGEIFRDPETNQLMIRLNWAKRYITLGPIATIIGVAFYLYDPENLLGKGVEIGMTLALIPSKTKGIIQGNRHDPLGIKFVNGPLWGEDVDIPITSVIGEESGFGNGWKMLMECLSAGRGISLPAVASGGATTALRIITSYVRMRRQFGLPIYRFQAISGLIGKMVGFNYMIEAARVFTAQAVDDNTSSSVISAIMKYNMTEMSRQLVNDGMDILGGYGIMLGEDNLLASLYKGMPIAITVEGANIMTRSYMILAQGLFKCHPQLYQEVMAIMTKNSVRFDKMLMQHIRFAASNLLRSSLFYILGGPLINQRGVEGYFIRKIKRSSASFSTLVDISLLVYGGSLKQQEHLTASLSDALIWMYFATATINRYQNEVASTDSTQVKNAKELIVQWCLEYCFAKIDGALNDVLVNFGKGSVNFVSRNILATLGRMHPIAQMPSNSLTDKLTTLVEENPEVRNLLIKDHFIPDGKQQDIEEIYKQSNDYEVIFKKVRQAQKAGTVGGKDLAENFQLCAKNGLITLQEFEFASSYLQRCAELVKVSAFSAEDYMKNDFTKPLHA